MSSSSGPRKFSEKIALLNQKQAEADAAFMNIMGEVHSIVIKKIFLTNKYFQKNKI